MIKIFLKNCSFLSNSVKVFTGILADFFFLFKQLKDMLTHRKLFGRSMKLYKKRPNTYRKIIPLNTTVPQ